MLMIVGMVKIGQHVMSHIVLVVLTVQGEMDGVVMLVLRGPTLDTVGDHVRPVVQERTLGVVRDHARLVPRTPIHRVAVRL